MQLIDYLRASHVKRWQIVSTLKSQSVAEHSFNVAMIALELHTIIHMRQNPEGERDRRIENDIIQWSLFHDIPEILTGDISTVVKESIKDLGIDPFSIVEDKVSSGRYSVLKYDVSNYVKDIVKFADIIDGIYFLHEYGANKHSEKVRLNMESKLYNLLNTPVYKKLYAVPVEMVLNSLINGELTTLDKPL